MNYIRRLRGKEVRFAALAGFTQSLTYSFVNTSLFVAIFCLHFEYCD